MYKIRIDNFDLEQVAKSGQCFRWLKNGENTYNIAAFGREVDIPRTEMNLHSAVMRMNGTIYGRTIWI